MGTTSGVFSITPAHAQAATEGLAWRHALSVFGDVKYPADFKRYDYVNPNAPKGGVVRLFEQGTFDNFNTVVMGFKGSIARGATIINETLTTRSMTKCRPPTGCSPRLAPIPMIFPTSFIG